MKLKIEINMENAAFESPGAGSECARILHRLADEIDGEELERGELISLRDINGNTVGKAHVQ